MLVVWREKWILKPVNSLEVNTNSFNEKTLSSFIERNNIMLVGMYTSFAHTDINSKFILNLKKSVVNHLVIKNSNLFS